MPVIYERKTSDLGLDRPESDGRSEFSAIRGNFELLILAGFLRILAEMGQDYQYYDESQHLFERTLKGLWTGIKLLFRLLIYSPLFFLGFFLATLIMPHNREKLLLWGLLAVGIAMALYCLVYFLKGILVGLRDRGSIWWVPVFLLCVGIACVPGVFLALEPASSLLKDITKNPQPNPVWVWGVSVLFGLVVLFYYGAFLSGSAPRLARPFYEAGLHFTNN